MASTASFPTPSHIKMLSTIVVPPSKLPTESAISVIMVSIEDFITFFKIITCPLTPLAFAPVT